MGLFGKKNAAEAAPKQNDSKPLSLEECYDRGTAYRKGIGVEQNMEEAFKWYSAAAEKGHAKAQYGLAVLYFNGQGTKRDIMEAQRWAAAALNNGVQPAEKILERIFQIAVKGLQTGVKCHKQGDYANAAVYFLTAAKLGLADAQLAIAIMYNEGTGVEKNETEAARWCYRSAAQDCTEAQALLGMYYAEGIGVEKSMEGAAEWFSVAAEKGNASAQYNLAVMYSKGIAVKQSREQAVYWARKSAENGDESAKRLLSALTSG